jgi:hypothetical protein
VSAAFLSLVTPQKQRTVAAFRRILMLDIFTILWCMLPDYTASCPIKQQPYSPFSLFSKCLFVFVFVITISFRFTSVTESRSSTIPVRNGWKCDKLFYSIGVIFCGKFTRQILHSCRIHVAYCRNVLCAVIEIIDL